MSAQKNCDCGCCGGIRARTPGVVENRSGLSAIEYRIGTHAKFRDSAIAGLNRTALRSRESGDFSIALIDAWACVADVLTFYQERIANESYLRTATEQLSLVELARLIGYELAPGVAASAWLAFTVDEAEGGPEAAVVPKGTRVQSVPGQDEEPQTFETDADLDARRAWNVLRPRTTKAQTIDKTTTFVWLEGTDFDLNEGDPLLIAIDGESHLARVTSVAIDDEQARTLIAWGDAKKLTPASQPAQGIYAMRVQASLFAYNAPHRQTLWPANATLIEASVGLEWDFAFTDLQLDNIYSDIHKESWVVLESVAEKRLDRVTDVTESWITRYTVSGPSTKLTIAGGTDNFTNFKGAANYRSTAVYAASELLPLADRPFTGPLDPLSIELDQHVDDLAPGRALIIRDGQASELAIIDKVVNTNPAHTVINLKSPLAHAFDPYTTAIFANVVAASHGESIRELLGSGDGTEAFQRFTLKQPPLTYVSAKAARGSASTLSVFVNDTRWTEVPTLYGAAATDRVYITRRDADNKTTIQFGDGISGSRLPTGNNNVRAEYRKGLGRPGLVRAGQLALLMTTPFGVSDVVNPMRSEGAVDPESLATARSNASRTVLTLDRVVSLLDYQNFARSFGSIAKSLATWTRAGAQPVVVLTVAGQDGAPVDPSSALYRDLTAALRRFGNPNVPLRIRSYVPRYFRISARVGIAPDRVPGKVMAAVKAALQSAFSFEARSFAQSVDRSEVFAVMQGVSGVTYVDIDLFRRTDHSNNAERLIASAEELITLAEWAQQDVKEMA